MVWLSRRATSKRWKRPVLVPRHTSTLNIGSPCVPCIPPPCQRRLRSSPDGGSASRQLVGVRKEHVLPRRRFGREQAGAVHELRIRHDLLRNHGPFILRQADQLFHL